MVGGAGALAKRFQNRLAPHFELSDALAIDAQRNHVKMHKDAGLAGLAEYVHGVDWGVDPPDRQ